MTNPEKVELEKEIIQIAARIPFTDTPSTWLDSSELDDFTDTFYQLADVYKLNDTEDFVKSINF